MSRRIEKVDQLIKKELSGIILKELNFPRDLLVTLTRVEVSSDLREAKVYVSVLPAGKGKDVLQTLDSFLYLLQQKLNKRLQMRPLPRIVFKKEEKTGEAGRIEELLEKIKKNS